MTEEKKQLEELFNTMEKDVALSHMLSRGYLKELYKILDTNKAKAEEQAVQQLTGMHYSEGKNVKALCIGMDLTPDEWGNIKDDCSWLDEEIVIEIEDYIENYD